MKKKFLNFMLIGAFSFALSSSFVACSSDDYDDDIKDLQGQIDKLKTDLAALQTAVGTFVKSVTYDEATGKLTVTSNTGSSTIDLGKNTPVKYTLSVSADGKITLVGDDGSSTSADIQFPAGSASFDPTKLTTNAAGEVLYDGVKTGVTIPASTSASMVEIKQGETVVGYTIKIGDQSADFYINDALPLKSIVFEPEAYLGGVEAMKARTINYDIWTFNSLYKRTPHVDYPYGDIELWNAPSTGKGNITPDIIAVYHLNPASVSKDQIKSLSIKFDDKEYVSKTRGATFNPEVTGYEVKNGMLEVGIKFAGQNIQAIDSDLISVLALQVTTTNGDAKVVTSDYAAVYKTVIDNLTLAFVDKGAVLHRDHLWGAYNDGRTNGTTTLKGRAEDAIWNYATSQERAHDYEVLYNDTKGIDLKEKVIIQYDEWKDVISRQDPADRLGASHSKTLTAEELEKFGLSLNFTLSDYWSGGNETHQKDFATVTDGVLKAKLFNTGVEDPYAAVNRMPIVRVELKHGNNVINTGWIKVKIVKDKPESQEWGKVFNYIQPDCAGVKLSTTVEEMNTQIYQKVGMSKEDFHRIYKLKVDASNNAIPQNTDFAGTVKEVVDQGPSTHTTLLEWTLPAATVWLDADGKFKITVVYEVAGEPDRDFVITFTTESKKPTATYNNKIDQYWSENMTAIEVNTVVPGQGSTNDADINTDIDNVFTMNKPGFTINWPTGTYENTSASFKPADLTYSYFFVEPAVVRSDLYSSMNDKDYGLNVIGNDNKSYTLGVVTNTNGSFLTATRAGVTQLVAFMHPTTGVVTYNNNYVLGADYRDHTNVQTLPQRPWLNPNIVPAGISTSDTYAKALLNKAARSSGSEFYAWVGVRLANGCDMALESNEIFKSKYLRPVNVAPTSTKPFIDGVDNGSTLNMLDLAVLSDWRGYAFADNLSYYNYYGIKSITINVDEIKTNLNNSDINNDYLKDITSNIKITQTPTGSTTTPDYGIVRYTNNGNTVGAFTLRIPVIVEYLWGTVITSVDVNVQATVGGN